MPLRRSLLAALLALSLGLTAVVLMQGGFSDRWALRVAQVVAVIVVVAGLLAGVAAMVGVRLAGWRDPESEEDFERLVLRTERLARDGTAAEPDEYDFLDLDPYDDEDFAELVRDALDDLPDLLRGVLERNVAVVISDDGRRHRAYGLYRGAGAHRDEYADQIIIFRDTLRRDFGHDPELLRAEVTKTVRHELAHHIGFDELGVRDLGL
jgi:predicted Zn-dependent protease with MMP-like domain